MHHPTTSSDHHPTPTAAPTSPAVGAGRRRDRGASMVEYAMLIALIAIVCMSAVTLFGDNTRGSLSRSSNSVAEILE